MHAVILKRPRKESIFLHDNSSRVLTLTCAYSYDILGIKPRLHTTRDQAIAFLAWQNIGKLHGCNCNGLDAVSLA